MDETAVNEPAGAAFRRILAKAAAIGVVAGLIAMGSAGAPAALGAFAGSLAAGIYAVGYVRSHVYRPFTDRVFDARIAGLATMRMVVVALAGAGVLLAFGQPGVKAYLLAFLVCFAIELITEAPRAAKQLRARGIIG